MQIRPFLVFVALILAAASKVHATEALIFDGGGYNIQIMIGYEDDPAVAQVLFTLPGAKDWVTLPSNLLHVEKFDMEENVLVLHFSNKNNPELPRSFSLSVKKSKAVLSIGGKEIRSEFSWDI